MTTLILLSIGVKIVSDKMRDTEIRKTLLQLEFELLEKFEMHVKLVLLADGEREIMQFPIVQYF